MKNRDWKLFLEDIMESIGKIEKYIEGISFENFVGRQIVIDAVIRNLEIIGEACKHIPARIRKRYEKIPWKAIIGLRDIATHEYFGLDLENIWKIVREDIPKNKETFTKILENE